MFKRSLLLIALSGCVVSPALSMSSHEVQNQIDAAIKQHENKKSWESIISQLSGLKDQTEFSGILYSFAAVLSGILAFGGVMGKIGIARPQSIAADIANSPQAFAAFTGIFLFSLYNALRNLNKTNKLADILSLVHKVQYNS